MPHRKRNCSIFDDFDKIDKQVARRQRREEARERTLDREEEKRRKAKERGEDKKWRRERQEAEKRERAKERREDKKWRKEKKEAEARRKKQSRQKQSSGARPGSSSNDGCLLLFPWIRKKRERYWLAQTEINALSPQKFEEYIAWLYKKRGYKARLRGGVNTSDHGVDIEVRRGGEYTVVQCKRYSGKVGEKEVRDLLGVTQKEKASRGVLVASNGFTEPALSWAKGASIELAGPDTINKWMEECKAGPYAELEPETSITPSKQRTWVWWQ